jgi:hypothetical protein
VTATPRDLVESATRKGIAVVDLDVDLKWTTADSAAVRSQRSP